MISVYIHWGLAVTKIVIVLLDVVLKRDHRQGALTKLDYEGMFHLEDRLV
jgi:hypothetical protein